MSVPVESDEPSNAVRQTTFFNQIARNDNRVEVLEKSGINYQTESIVQTVTNGDTTHSPSGDAVYDFTNGIVVQTVTNGDTTHVPSADAVFDYVEAKRLTATATLDFPSIPAGTVAVLTMTVTGAAENDAVALGPPSAMTAGLMWSGRVNGANTISIRLFNGTGSAIDPGSATWRATVFK